MARQVLLVSAFLLFLNVSLVLCRDDYYQHFSNQFSHYHRKSTPEDNVSSTEASVPPSEETSVSGLPHETALNSTGESGGKQHGVSPTYDIPIALKSTGGRYGYHEYGNGYQTYYEYNYRTALQIRMLSIVVSLVLVAIGLIIIFCCGKKIGRNVRTGHIVNRCVQPPQPGFSVSQQHTQNPQGVELRKVPPPPYPM